jgi:hypothetical protein
MKEGKLYFDGSADRYDISFKAGGVYGGLHCGNCFDLLTADGWQPTRIEYDDNEGWYLKKFRDRALDGLTVRI